MNQSQILDSLRAVIDPELGINIVDLGLVYRVAVEDNCISVVMTMTTPTCPLGEMILSDAYVRLRTRFPQADDVLIDMVWNPTWTPERMSPDAKKQLGWG